MKHEPFTLFAHQTPKLSLNSPYYAEAYNDISSAHLRDMRQDNILVTCVAVETVANFFQHCARFDRHGIITPTHEARTLTVRLTRHARWPSDSRGKHVDRPTA